MNGYITIVCRVAGAYRVEIIGLPQCTMCAPTVDGAFHEAQKALHRWVAAGNDLPAPRPAHDVIAEARRHSAVAGACLRERAATGRRTR